LSRLLVVVERYPDLKANQGFMNLQVELAGTENRIANERRVFNDKVRDYNTYIQQVPATFIASFRNFRPKPYFEATAGSDRPPQVQFDFGAGTNK
jgi:LemA protein